MKKIILLLALFSFSSFVLAQNVKVPEKIQAAFAKTFPKATEVKWEKESANEFEASFKNENAECSAAYTAKGKFIESETGIQVSELPRAALDLIKNKHADHQISKAFKITDAKGKVSFEAEITKGKETKELLFSEAGKLVIKKEKAGEKGKKDKEKD